MSAKHGWQVDDGDPARQRETAEGLLDHGKCPRRLVGEVPQMGVPRLLEAGAGSGQVSPARARSRRG